jgi:hypothetical protein
MKIQTFSLLNRYGAIAACLAISLAASVAARGQGEDSIRVLVNGDPVRFEGIGPREIDGRLMVPLRGVLEKTGANVDWLPATQTVVAARGGLMLELNIGSRSARVNGRSVRMDVPAMTIAGSTMVPLRFVTESLGGQVDWDRRTRTVSIESPDRDRDDRDRDETRNIPNRRNRDRADRDRTDRDREDTRNEGRSSRPQITSITHNIRSNVLGAGQRFHIVVHGTPGGQGWFRIRGSVGALKMQETEPGVYEGYWRNDQNRDLHVDYYDILAFVVVKNTSTPETMPDGVTRPK